MITKSALRELAKRIAHQRDRRPRAASSRGLGEALAADTDAVPGLIELIAAEASRKRPSARMTWAYLHALSQVLEEISKGVERDLPEARHRAEAARGAVLDQMKAGDLGGLALLRVLRAFLQAGLDPSGVLRAAVETDPDAGLDDSEPAAPATFIGRGGELSALADMLCGNPFRLHAELAEQVAALPHPVREGLVRSLAASADPRLREAAVGWLLDEDAPTRQVAADALGRAAQAGEVTGPMLRRMVTVRNWIPPRERTALDAAILCARQSGAEIESVGEAVVKGVYVSGFDGSGAQSLVALSRRGRRHAALAALFRLGGGIPDAWVRTGLTLDGGLAMVAEMDASVGAFEADLDYLRSVLPHLLAAAVDAGRLPPFGLVDVIERLGLAAINPAPRALDDLIDGLCESVPTLLATPVAMERALLASGAWNRELPFIAAWYEDDPSVLAPAAGLNLSRLRRLDLIVRHVLPDRRDWWAEIIASTAHTLSRGPRPPPLWIDMALVAREIRRGRPLGEIPIMTYIAAATVEAWGGRL